MNYLKKKLKAHKRAVEDDEDYGDYIPATPPHPSELGIGAQQSSSHAIGQSPGTGLADGPVTQPAYSASQAAAAKPPPKFVIPPKETKEEWQFFAQLTARVQQTVAASEAQLEKIKATTNVDEIEADTEKPYYFAEELEELDQKFEQKFSNLSRSPSTQPTDSLAADGSSTAESKRTGTSAQPKLGPVTKPIDRVTTISTSKKPPGKWVNVEASIDEPVAAVEPPKNSRTKATAKEAAKATEPKSEEDLELKRTLAEDFGFRKKSLDLTEILTEEEIIKNEDDYLTDPFDTEHIEERIQKEVVESSAKMDTTERSHVPPTSLPLSASQSSIGGKNGASKLRSVPCTPGERVQAEEIDIETTLKTGRLSRYASREDVQVARSLAQTRCNSVQSLHQLTRRDSTNPFEIEAEIERRMSATSSPQSEHRYDMDEQAEPDSDNVPNAIAALTEEFCKTISGLSSEFDHFDSDEKPTANEKTNVPTLRQDSKSIDETVEEIKKRSLDYEISPESDVERPLGSNAEINEISMSGPATGNEDGMQNTYELRPNEEEDEEKNGGGMETGLSEFNKSQHPIHDPQPFDPFATIVEEESTSNRVSLSSTVTAESGHEYETNASRRESDVFHNVESNHPKPFQQDEPPREAGQSVAGDSSDISPDPTAEHRTYFDPFEPVKEQSPSAPASPIDQLTTPRQSVRIQELPTISGTLDEREGGEKGVGGDDGIVQSPSLSAKTDSIECEAQQLVEQITSSAAQIAEQRVSDIDEWRQSARQQSFDLTPAGSPLVEMPPSGAESIESNKRSDSEMTDDHDMPPPPPPIELSHEIDLNEVEELDLPPPPLPDDEVPPQIPEVCETIEEMEPDAYAPTYVEPEQVPSLYATEQSTIVNEYPAPPFETIDTTSQVDVSSVEVDIPMVDDPFDTSIYELNSEGGARYANKKEMDAFDRKFDRTTVQSQNDQVDAFASPLPTRKLAPDANVFDLFDPYASPSRPPRNTPVAGHRPMAPIRTTRRRRRRRHHRRSASGRSSDSESEARSGASGSSDDDEKGSSSFESDDSDETRKIHFVIREQTPDDLRESQETPPPIPPPPAATVKARKRKERGIFNEPLLRVGRNRAKLAQLRPDDYKSPEEPELEVDPHLYANLRKQQLEQAGEVERPETPLFEESTEALEEFENPYEQLQWNVYARYPIKKKITGNRFWKMITVRFVPESGTIQVLPLQAQPSGAANGSAVTGEPIQEIQMQASYTVSEINSQQYDQFGKIFTLKLQYTFYREKAGAETGKKLAHNVKVMQGKLAHFTQKFNHMVNVNVDKLNLHNKDNLLVASALLQHTANSSELIKLASHDYELLRSIKRAFEHCLFHLPARRERTLTYRAEEIQTHIQDECWIRLNARGHILEQKARVRLFLLAFLNGPDAACEIGLNDIRRQGNEVVGRYDILPITTEQWIRVENAEFHSSVDQETFEQEQRLVRLVPPDACQFEFMRFRVRPPQNRELPLQVSAKLYVGDKKVELRVEAMAAGAVSRKADVEIIPCEDIAIRIHIPECWIYFFRTEKHLRFGSVKSANRRPGKIKGIERFLGATTNLALDSSLLEVSAGQAKYEHAFHSLVWRIPRLPKEGQGAYVPQTMLMRLPLSSFDQVPDKFYEFVHVEFKMPATTVSHAVIRSISVSGCDAPPEKYANYVSLYEYVVDLPIIHANDDNPYNLAVGAVRKPTASGQHDTPSFGEAEAAKDSDDSEDYYPNYDEEDEEEEEEALKQETPAAGVRIVGSATASPARPPPPTRTT